MSLSNTTFDDVESVASQTTIQELNCQKRTPLQASAPQFEPSGAWGAPMVWNFANEMNMDPWLHDSIHANRDGNVYMFNFDLMSDVEGDSDDDKPRKGQKLENPVGLGLSIGPPPGLEAVAAWPEHTLEHRQEARPKIPWWRQPCPFNAQVRPTAVRVPCDGLPGQRPWRSSAGHDAAHSLLHQTWAERVAPKVQKIDSSADKAFVKDSLDNEDTETTGSFKSDSDDADSE